MKKKILCILLSILTLIPVQTLTNIKGKAKSPITNQTIIPTNISAYFEFNNIKDSAYDEINNRLYILEGNISGENGKIVVFDNILIQNNKINLSTTKSQVLKHDKIISPSQIFISGDDVYILENGKINIFSIAVSEEKYNLTFRLAFEVKNSSISRMDLIKNIDSSKPNFLVISYSTSIGVYSVSDSDIQLLKTLSSHESAQANSFSCYFDDENNLIITYSYSYEGTPYLVFYNYTTDTVLLTFKNFEQLPSDTIYFNNDLYFISGNNLYRFPKIKSATQNSKSEILLRAFPVNEIQDDNFFPELGRFIEPTSISIMGNKLILTDNSRMKTLSFFTLEDARVPVFDNAICSKANSYNRLNNPSDISEFGENIFIADSGNKRIAITNKTTFTTTYIDVQNLGVPKFIAGGMNKFIFATSSKVYLYSLKNDKWNSDSPTVLSITLNNITDVSYSSDDNFYVLDSGNNKIFKIDRDNNISTFIENIPANSKLICNDLRNGYLYLYTGSEIISYSANGVKSPFPETEKESITLSDDIKSLNCDFGGNIFILTNSVQSKSKIIKFNKQTDFKEEIIEIQSDIFDCKKSSGLALDIITKKAYISYSMGYVLDLKIDITAPVDLQIPTDIMKKEFAPITVGVIGAYPSNILLPLNKEDPLFPTDSKLAHTGSLKLLEKDSEVIILGENGNYYYVFQNGQAGFIAKDGIVLKANEPLAINEKMTNWDTHLYKYPSIHSVVLTRLKKNTELTINSTAFSYSESSSMNYFYEVTIQETGEKGYVLRSSITSSKPDTDFDDYTYKVIKGKLPSGMADVFSSPNGDIVAVFRDNTKVKVFDIKDGWAFIEGIDASGNLVKGYVPVKSLSDQGLSLMSTIGIGILAFVIIGGFITILVIVSKKKKYK